MSRVLGLSHWVSEMCVAFLAGLEDISVNVVQVLSFLALLGVWLGSGTSP